MQKCDPKTITDQVRRTEGQVSGIGRMVAEQRSCAEVLQQIVAARASLSKLAILLLQAEAQGCMGTSAESATKSKDLELVVHNLFKLS